MSDPQMHHDYTANRFQRALDWLVERRGQLMQGLLMLLFFFALGLLKLAIGLMALVQFGFLLARGTPNAHLRLFGSALARYCHDIVAFLACTTEAPPFPFSEWPGSDPELTRETARETDIHTRDQG